MPLLKSTKTTYLVNLDELKILIADDLKVNADAVTVRFVMTDQSGYGDRSTNYQVTGVEVIVDNTINEPRTGRIFPDEPGYVEEGFNAR